MDPGLIPLLIAAAPETAAGATIDDITLAAYAAPGFGLGVAAAAPAFSLTPVLVSLAASTAISYAISLLTKPNDIPGAPPQLTVRQALPSRFVMLGRAKTAGVLFFNDVAVSNGALCIGKVMACHKVNAFEQHFLFEYPVDLSTPTGGTIVDPPDGRSAWSTLVSVNLHLGEDDQAADGTLIGLFGPPLTVWTAAHQLKGLAYVVAGYLPANVKDGTFYTDYPNGAPEYKAVIQGRLVYDPRDGSQDINDESTWEYSDNAALILAWYLMHEDGWGLGPSVIDIGNLITEAGVCDELVPTPDGGNEPRYRIWGSYQLSEQRKSVLGDLLQACLGRIQMEASGTVKITVGRAIPPTVTLDEDIIVAVENFIDGPDPTERVGTVNPRITYEPANWMTYDVPPVTAIVYNSDNRFGSNVLDLPLRFCPSPYQAQRIAKKIIDEKNSGWRGNLRCSLAGLKAYGEWVVKVSITELGIVDGLFEVINLTLDRSNMTVVVAVREMSADVFDWTRASGTLVNVEVPQAQTTFPVTAPTSVVAASVAIGGNWGIQITWLNPDSSIASNQVQYRPAAPPSELGWIEDDPPSGALSVTTPALTTGAFYDLRVRSVGSSGNVSDWQPVFDVKNGP